MNDKVLVPPRTTTVTVDAPTFVRQTKAGTWQYGTVQINLKDRAKDKYVVRGTVRSYQAAMKRQQGNSGEGNE